MRSDDLTQTQINILIKLNQKLGIPFGDSGIDYEGFETTKKVKGEAAVFCELTVNNKQIYLTGDKASVKGKTKGRSTVWSVNKDVYSVCLICEICKTKEQPKIPPPGRISLNVRIGKWEGYINCPRSWENTAGGVGGFQSRGICCVNIPARFRKSKTEIIITANSATDKRERKGILVLK